MGLNSPIFFWTIFMKNLILILCLILFVSCKSTNESEPKHKIEEVQPTESNARFIVSFISKGSSIDFKSREKLVAYLDSNKIVYNKVSWGREGEMDYCLALSDSNEETKAKLIEEIKTLLESSDLIRYKENTPCRESK